MLSITVQPTTLFNEDTQTFLELKQPIVLRLEHSLVSISKWEAKFHKSYFIEEKTVEETLYYLKCMTLNQHVDDLVYLSLSNRNLREIQNYISDPRTATTFPPSKQGVVQKTVITSELIYYWMFANQIPIEAQKWHINRLLTLIRVFQVKNDTSTKKRMSASEINSRNKALNDERRRKLNTKG